MRCSTWYPLGCGVEIASNSDDVHRAALHAWGDYSPQPAGISARLTINVTPAFAEISETPPMPRGEENLISIVDNRMNCAVADLSRGFATIFLSANAARNTRYLLETFLEPITFLILGARHFVMAHAASVSLGGRGVLLCGDSGAGKTCLSYVCAKSGWTFLSGDATQIVRGSAPHEIVGRPYSIRFRPSAARLFPELTPFPVSQRTTKADVECATKALALKTALRSNLNHIVFLDRTSQQDAATLQEFGRREALEWLETAVFYGDGNVRAQQRETLKDIVRQPVWRLTYSEPGEAERALRGLVSQS